MEWNDEKNKFSFFFSRELKSFSSFFSFKNNNKKKRDQTELTHRIEKRND